MRAWERRLQQLAERPMVLVGGVVVLLAIGALGLGLRGEVELGKQEFRPDLTPTLLVIFVACVITFFVVIATMPKQRPGAPPRKRVNPLAQAAGLVTVAALFYFATQCAPRNAKDPLPAVTMPGSLPSAPPAEAGGPGAGAQSGAGIGLAVLVALAILATVGLVWWRSRDGFAPAEERTDAEDLRQAIAAGQVALSGETDARSAVIAAYAAMEHALGRAGLSRRVADTPAEILSRAGQAGLFGPAATAAAAELTELFERARFSDRPMPLGAREYAERALAGMDADLEAAIARAAEAKLAEEAKRAKPADRVVR